jgi:hypothetical protein
MKIPHHFYLLSVCFRQFQAQSSRHDLTSLSAISWRPVLVVEEAGVPGENHRPWASNW